ncbi:Fic/DOC family protein [Aeromicrobium sp. Sec7.5]|uniref:Fic/DOC family protein n=1 Tax=Aeromicrobium sp. Sec7.5 TaxID=3121276 RepID=UPI002FE4D2A1
MLRNKFTGPGKPHGETDPDVLRVLEEGAALVRLTELSRDPIEGAFDYDHMKAIHRHVFQDVYEWAGEERVAPVGQFMNKDGHAYYPAGPALSEAAHAEYAKIAAADFLHDLGPDEFVDELAERWGEVNVIHSFREGNTRTQFAFFSQLAEQAGYEFDTAQFAIGSPLREEFVQARFHGQDTGNNDRLAAVLRQVVVPLDRSGDDLAVDHDLVKSVRKSREAAGYLKFGTQPPVGPPQERAARRSGPSRQSEGYER